MPNCAYHSEFTVKTNPLISALVLICLATGASGFMQGANAQDVQHGQEQRSGQQGNQHSDERDQQGRAWRQDQYQQNGQRASHQRQRDQQEPRSDQRQSQARSQQYRAPDYAQGQVERGAGPDHNWHRGDRLPAEYRSRAYVVDDWRSHNLSAPPRGYHWVQHGSDYVLASVATGIIAQLLLNH